MTARIFVVALTGGIGSGKSTVVECFLRRGARVVDVDIIAHRLTASPEILMEMVRRLGFECRSADGSLDRPLLRRRIFSDPGARRILESFLHPLIRDEARRELFAIEDGYALLVVPLLLETGAYTGLYQRLLVVDCPEEEQIRRVVRRDGGDADSARAILAAQIGRDERVAAADDVVDNGGDIKRLETVVDGLHRRYCEMAANFRKG